MRDLKTSTHPVLCSLRKTLRRDVTGKMSRPMSPVVKKILSVCWYSGRTHSLTIDKHSWNFKGAVSRYSVIFLHFFVRGKRATAHASVADTRPWQLGQPREQLHRPSWVEKMSFPRAIVVFRGLALWPTLFFPTQNGCQKSAIIVTLPL